MPTKEKNRNVILDLLRIVAIVEIFLMHLTLFIPEEVGNKVFAVMSKISSRGANGVAVLFCLSGYLIFKELADKEYSYRQYYTRRMKRIVPVYYFVLLLYIAAGLLPFNAQILRYFFFANGLIPSHNYQLYNNAGAFWTMGCFMIWYLVAPWLQKQIKNLKSAVLATIIMFVLGRLLKVILRFVYVYFQVDEITYMLGNNPFGNLYLFGMGIVAYYAIKEEKVKEGILISMTAITVLSYLNSPWYLYWMFLAEVFILLSSQISLKLPTGIGKIVTFLSNVSFDLYLVHLGVISRLADTEIQDKYGSLCFVVCTVIATVLCSILVYYVDQLILKRLFQHIGK